MSSDLDHRHATRRAALTVAACCAVLLGTTAFTELRDVDTNIDTGNITSRYIVVASAIIGLCALVVCLVTGLVRLTRPRRTSHVYRWWAVAGVSVAVVVIAGSLS